MHRGGLELTQPVERVARHPLPRPAPRIGHLHPSARQLAGLAEAAYCVRVSRRAKGMRSRPLEIVERPRCLPALAQVIRELGVVGGQLGTVRVRPLDDVRGGEVQRRTSRPVDAAVGRFPELVVQEAEGFARDALGDLSREHLGDGGGDVLRCDSGDRRQHREGTLASEHRRRFG